MRSYHTNLPREKAADRIEEFLVPYHAQINDKYTQALPDGPGVTVLVFTRHSFRAGGRCSLTVTVCDLSSPTAIRGIGGQGV